MQCCYYCILVLLCCLYSLSAAFDHFLHIVWVFLLVVTLFLYCISDFVGCFVYYSHVHSFLVIVSPFLWNFYSWLYCQFSLNFHLFSSMVKHWENAIVPLKQHGCNRSRFSIIRPSMTIDCCFPFFFAAQPTNLLERKTDGHRSSKQSHMHNKCTNNNPSDEITHTQMKIYSSTIPLDTWTHNVHISNIILVNEVHNYANTVLRKMGK